ncbi:MAG: hypothetical protein AAF797_14605 [Planctomycetota bacterium]
MKRWLRASLVSTLTALGVTGCMHSTVTDDPPAALAQSDERLASYDAAMARLATPITARLDGVPYRDAFERLSEQTGVRFEVHTASLTALGVPETLKIRMTLDDQPGTSHLDLILSQVRDAVYPRKVSMEWLGDRMLVGSDVWVVEASRWVKVYPIADLLDASTEDFARVFRSNTNTLIKTFPNLPSHAPQTRPAEARPGAGPESDLAFFDDDRPNTEGPLWYSDATRVEVLGRLVMDTVGDYGHWLDEHAQLRMIDGQMIVRAPTSYHLQIRSLLRSLRAASKSNRVLELSVKRFSAIHHAATAERFRRAGDHTQALVEIRTAQQILPDHPLVRAVADMITQTTPPATTPTTP